MQRSLDRGCAYFFALEYNVRPFEGLMNLSDRHFLKYIKLCEIVAKLVLDQDMVTLCKSDPT